MNASVVIHQHTAWWRSHRATSRCTAGSVCRHRSGRGGKQIPRTSAPTSRLSLAPFQPHEKTVGQHHRDGMAVETRPQPTLIVIPPQFSLGLFMKLLDGMPAMGIGDQLLHWGRGGQVTPIVLMLLGLPTGGALAEQPADVSLSLRRDPPGAH